MKTDMVRQMQSFQRTNHIFVQDCMMMVARFSYHHDAEGRTENPSYYGCDPLFHKRLAVIHKTTPIIKIRQRKYKISLKNVLLPLTNDYFRSPSFLDPACDDGQCQDWFYASKDSTVTSWTSPQNLIRDRCIVPYNSLNDTANPPHGAIRILSTLLAVTFFLVMV